MKGTEKVECCICLETLVKYTRFSPVASSSSRPPPPPPRAWQVNLVHSAGCNHYICKHCLERYLNEYLNDHHDSYDKIQCPYLGCKRTYIAERIVGQVMPNRAAHDRWWLKVYEKTVMDSIGYCPYRDCQGVFELPHQAPETEHVPRFAECVECHRGICMSCQNQWHPDRPCLDGRSATPTWQFSQRYHEQRENNRKKLTRKNSLDARRLADSKNWTRCPKCKQMVEKADGCSTVKCRCGALFCFNCGSYSNDHTCTKQCHKLSREQLRALRQPMFMYN
ncbi:hypothetical protein BJV82DRAFT_575310 [Fennellomyces sp. T-0311]|nr:hypothetical protein BJV82DRAFT_575310 [Fennellomyces sp. T-0311]